MELKKHREIKTDEQLRERTGLGGGKQKNREWGLFQQIQQGRIEDER
jgi:hypothetical protein